MYHCGTPMVLEHIASGMYGMMIVEPRGGYPTKVDREYTVVQSEFYTKPDPAKRKVDGKPLHVLDNERLRTSSRLHGLQRPLQRHGRRAAASQARRARAAFVLNAGPSNTSSFHVVGTIFDRVWIDGNPDNQFRGMQTVLLGSSNGAIVEFMIPEAGSYVMVDHHFANASQGAIGLSRRGSGQRATPSTTTSRPPPTPSEPRRCRASSRSRSKCLACHSIGGGDKLGPDLYGSTKRHDDAWLTRWLKAPEQMMQTDAKAKAMLEKWKIPMPNQGLSDGEIKQYLAYLKWADQNVKKP